MRHAGRLDLLPEYVMTRLNRIIAERRAAGHDVISLAMGDPDQRPTANAVRALLEAVERPDAHSYPAARGTAVLREAVAGFYLRRFGVAIDPDREVLPLLGAKEGIAHLALALVGPGDVALIADPGYPVYASGPILAGAEPVSMPLRPETGFQLDLAAIEPDSRARANLLIAGYPNNPTGALAAPGALDAMADFGQANGIAICHDNAYSEIWFDGPPPSSYLASPGAMETGIELYSLSKAYRIPGWRIAFAVGNADIIAALAKTKANIDSGMFTALQHAAAALLQTDEGQPELRADYARRRDLVCGLLAAAGVEVVPPGGALYVWMPVPAGETSMAFAMRLIESANVVVVPGVAYGPAGEGFVRLALTQPDDRLGEAVTRLLAAL